MIAARAANAQKIGNRAVGPELQERLQRGEKSGVVDGDYAQAARTGEVPAVTAEVKEDDVFDSATPVEKLPEGEFGKVVEARQIHVEDQGKPVDVEVTRS